MSAGRSAVHDASAEILLVVAVKEVIINSGTVWIYSLSHWRAGLFDKNFPQTSHRVELLTETETNWWSL